MPGTLDSPDQGAIGIPFSSVTFEEGTLTMAASSVPGVPTFTAQLSEDGTTLSGTFSQDVNEFPLELVKQE